MTENLQPATPNVSKPAETLNLHAMRTADATAGNIARWWNMRDEILGRLDAAEKVCMNAANHRDDVGRIEMLPAYLTTALAEWESKHE